MHRCPPWLLADNGDAGGAETPDFCARFPPFFSSRACGEGCGRLKKREPGERR